MTLSYMYSPFDAYYFETQANQVECLQLTDEKIRF